ncbi:MAG: hypothetical protein Q4F01_09990 [Staphylococcus rostri]|uniref:hypothetical protein n=1 Tax=Staphylococcus rostri TaxID=522262 RepID=UPI0026E0DD16|nr:hypothetical protein [Staphylococcus rostri]MDO5376495.1 hypothetical protein [Staphylococcus rostri]
MSERKRIMFGVLFVLIIVFPFLYIERESLLGISGGVILLVMAYYAFFKRQ